MLHAYLLHKTYLQILSLISPSHSLLLSLFCSLVLPQPSLNLFWFLVFALPAALVPAGTAATQAATLGC